MRIPTEELVKQYQDRLYAAALSICKNPEDAEDVVQDVFLKYHTSSKEFCDAEQPGDFGDRIIFIVIQVYDNPVFRRKAHDCKE